MNTHSGGNVMGQDAQNRTEEEPGMRLSGKSAALSSLCEALSSIPSTGKKKTEECYGIETGSLGDPSRLRLELRAKWWGKVFLKIVKEGTAGAEAQCV
jgi:hypothetical protein